MRCVIPLLVASLVLAQMPAVARAEDDNNAAVDRYQRGREHFSAGRYRMAIIELKAALALDPDSPNLMYNVAYTSELLGDLGTAIHYYRRYLVALPEEESEERTKIQGTLRRLEGHRVEAAADAARRHEELRSPGDAGEPPPFGASDTWFWLSFAGGLALLGGGAATGVLALERENAVADFVAGNDGSLSERNQLVTEADRFALASDVMLIGGTALLVTSAALLLLREPEIESRPRASIGIDGRGGLLLSFSGRL
ncbi:MAG: hypothetical protein OEZ06_29100 [Myxococcales bacterium]|nr:hypothetical protein [Myxococcales bacterium]